MPDHLENPGISVNTTVLADRSSEFDKQDCDDLRALQSGESDGLAGLVARHKGRVFRYIYSRVSNHQTAEDLTQEVFIRLCREEYNGSASVKTWVFTIARNRTIDFYRSESRRPRTGPFPAGFDHPEQRGSEPSRNLSQEDEDQRISRWLAELPDEQQDAVRLRIIGGLSFSQTANVLGCSIPTCKSRVRYGLAKLKLLIEEEIQS